MKTNLSAFYAVKKKQNENRIRKEGKVRIQNESEQWGIILHNNLYKNDSENAVGGAQFNIADTYSIISSYSIPVHILG